MVYIKLLLRKKTFLKGELSEQSLSFILCVHVCVADMILLIETLELTVAELFRAFGFSSFCSPISS